MYIYDDSDHGPGCFCSFCLDTRKAEIAAAEKAREQETADMSPAERARDEAQRKDEQRTLGVDGIDHGTPPIGTGD